METLVQSVPSLTEHTGSHKYSPGSKRSSLRSYLSPVSTSPSTIPNIILVLEPSNDTFLTKRIDLIEGVPVKVGRTTNKHTAPTEKNGYFDSKVLSRIHAEVWAEKGKVYIKDLKSSNGTFVNGRRISAESKESEPVELNDYDVLEFGIDIINNDDRKLMFSKVTTLVHIISSSSVDVSNGHNFKGESIYKRGLSQVFNPEDSIYATLESELYCARDENRRLAELSNVLGDMSKSIENKSNKLYSNDNLALFKKIEETQAKFNAHLEKCEIERNAKQKYQLYEKKDAQSKNPISDSGEHDDMDCRIKELSSRLACTKEQLTEEQAIHSNQVEELRRQVTETTSQLEMTRGELEDMKLRHGSKIEELNQQIYDMVNQLNHAHEELRTLYETDAANFKQLKRQITRGNFGEIQSPPVNPLDSSPIENCNRLHDPEVIQQANVLIELSDLRTKYEKMITDQESLITRITVEHASLIADKDNQISVIQEEKLDFASQFAQFRKETLNALDTVKRQLSTAQETISLIASENESLNSRLEKALTENEKLKVENIEIKAQFELWRKEKQVEDKNYRNLKNVDNLSVKGSNNVRFRPLNQHKKQESTIKDSEWTDNERDVENVVNDANIASIGKADQKDYKPIFVKGTIGVVLVGLGAYLISKFCN